MPLQINDEDQAYAVVVGLSDEECRLLLIALLEEMSLEKVEKAIVEFIQRKEKKHG